jgi:DNA-dependent RNA polymerase auxiliary subunit epsilon
MSQQYDLTLLSRLRNLEEVVTKKVKEMLKDKSLSVEKIATFAKVSVDYVKQLQHTLNL